MCQSVAGVGEGVANKSKGVSTNFMLEKGDEKQERIHKRNETKEVIKEH